MSSRKLICSAFFLFTLILLTLPAYAAGVLYVREGGAGDGTSWDNAFGDPQAAIELAAADEAYSQVWVAAGTYKPTGHPNGGVDSKEVHFSLRNGVTVYGGFFGNESKLSERDFNVNKTIFSGDIGLEGYISDNAYHVFYHPELAKLEETAVLDGVTVVGGNADYYSSPHLSGGGIYNNHSSPTITRTNIIENFASSCGAGLSNFNCNPLLVEVNIQSNHSSWMGGGIYNYNSNSRHVSKVLNTFETLWVGRLSPRASPSALACRSESGGLHKNPEWRRDISKNVNYFLEDLKHPQFYFVKCNHQ